MVGMQATAAVAVPAGVAGAVPGAGAAAGRYAVALPAGAAGRWCVVAVCAEGTWWGKVEAASAARGQVVREAFLGPRGRGGWRRLLLHVPRDADALELAMFGQADAPVPTGLRLRVLGRAETALRLLLGGWRGLPGIVRGDRAGLAGRLRTELGQAPARAGEAPPYAVWLRLYDGWGERERAALALDGAGLPVVEVAVVGDAAAAATLRSVEGQWLRPAAVSVVADFAAVRRRPGAWLVRVAAGDVLAPHALACFAHAIRRAPETRLFHADVDRLAEGVRSAPLFKPGADGLGLQEGLALQGACALHPGQAGDGAGAWRGGEAAVRHVPFILTHMGDVRPAARGAAVAVGNAGPSVSIVIASGCRSALMLRCLRGVLACTDYADFEIVLAVSAIDERDAAQRRVLAQVAALARHARGCACWIWRCRCSIMLR